MLCGYFKMLWADLFGVHVVAEMQKRKQAWSSRRLIPWRCSVRLGKRNWRHDGDAHRGSAALLLCASPCQNFLLSFQLAPVSPLWSHLPLLTELPFCFCTPACQQPPLHFLSEKVVKEGSGTFGERGGGIWIQEWGGCAERIKFCTGWGWTKWKERRIFVLAGTSVQAKVQGRIGSRGRTERGGDSWGLSNF